MALPGAGWPPLPLAMSSGPTVMIVILCYQTWDMGAGGGGQRHSNFDRNIKTSAHHSYTSGLRASGLQRLRVLPLSQKPPMKGHGLVSPPASHDWDSAPLGSRVSGGGAVTRQPWCRSDASTRLP